MTKRQRIQIMQKALSGWKFIPGAPTQFEAQLVLERYELFIDQANVGTDEYQGHGYFWNHAYRHTMREITTAGRRRVHKAWLEAGLNLEHTSKEHERLLEAALSKADHRLLG